MQFVGEGNNEFIKKLNEVFEVYLSRKILQQDI
jgi:hypothetical protein